MKPILTILFLLLLPLSLRANDQLISIDATTGMKVAIGLADPQTASPVTGRGNVCAAPAPTPGPVAAVWHKLVVRLQNEGDGAIELELRITW